MARIVFVTVGTSAITNRELWEKNGTLPATLDPAGNWGKVIGDDEKAAVEEKTRNNKRIKWEDIEAHVRAIHADFEKALTDHHRKFWETSPHHKREHPRRTSAEAMSTWLAGAAASMDGGPLKAGEDQVVLLVSRTCVGQMAGRINGALFREFLFVGDGERSVSTKVIGDLQFEGIVDDGCEGMSLSSQVRKIYADHTTNNGRTPLVNITGGFKGVIPAISVICADAGTTMLYLHDSMKGVVRLRFANGKGDEDFAQFHAEL